MLVVRQFLKLVLWASIFTAIFATARASAAPAAAVSRILASGFLKNGDTESDIVDCVEQLPEGGFRMVMTGDELEPCRLNFANGLHIRLDEGEIITTSTEGNSIHGMIRIYTSGLPYRLLGDQRHTIEPNATVDVVIEEHLTHVLSKEGETSVIACDVSEDSACVRRGFTLLQGDRITLTRDGQVNSWENSEGDDLTLDSQGGCSVGGKTAKTSLWAILALMWTLLWFRRRSIARDS